MNSHTRFSTVANRGAAAFGLIGLLLVMGIILYLMFGNMGGTTYMDQVVQTKKQGQKLSMDMQTHQLLTSIAQYKLSTDELPESMEDLEAPSGAFLDPWKKQVRFTCEDDRRTGRTLVHIVSAGPDGEFDTEDDVLSTRDLSI